MKTTVVQEPFSVTYAVHAFFKKGDLDMCCFKNGVEAEDIERARAEVIAKAYEHLSAAS